MSKVYAVWSLPSHPPTYPILVGLKDLAQNSASVGKVYRTSAHYAYQLTTFSSLLLSALPS